MSERALDSEHEGHLRALVAGGVDFVVIGGIAVMAHGYVRATADTDVTANPDRSNLERLSAVLKGLDAVLPGAGRLRIVQSPAGAPSYDDMANRAVSVDLGDLPLRVCAYQDLVAMKEATARDQDRLDLAALRDARGEAR